MSRVAGRTWLAVAFLAASFAFIAVVAPSFAKAEETVWICKPGQADDLCAGTIDGSTMPPPGQSAQPLGYTRPADAPVDCFYLYPTQSNQSTPNSNLDKDPPIKRVVVQQARMFSSVCDVYAPMYRQVTYAGNQLAHNPDVDVAYESAKAAFEDYLQNYNQGRGFIMLGHSQGSAHTARLIDELVDTNPELRERFVGAIAPGANISVPIGKNVGGLFANVPACSEVGEYGCLVAYSTYTAQPGPNAAFSRLDVGYWIYPEARPNPAEYEAVCVDPAQLDGSGGKVEPLANTDYLNGVPANETEKPWIGLPDYYVSSCMRAGGAHWLNVSKTNLPGDARPNLGALVGQGTNWHVPEVNIFEGNLLRIARNQTDSYLGDIAAEQERIAALQAKLKNLNASLAKAKKRQASAQKTVKSLSKKLKKAKSAKQRKKLKKKLKTNRKKVASEKKRVSSLKTQIAQVQRQIG